MSNFMRVVSRKNSRNGLWYDAVFSNVLSDRIPSWVCYAIAYFAIKIENPAVLRCRVRFIAQIKGIEW